LLKILECMKPRVGGGGGVFFGARGGGGGHDAFRNCSANASKKKLCLAESAAFTCLLKTIQLD